METVRKWKIKFDQGCILVVILYFLTAILLYYAAGDQLYERSANQAVINPGRDYPSEEFVNGFILRQTFRCDMDTMDGFSIYIAVFQRVNAGHLNIRLYDDTAGRLLYETQKDMSQMEEGQAVMVSFPKRLEALRGHMLVIELKSEDSITGNAVGAWCHLTPQPEHMQMYRNGEKVEGNLCFDTFGTDQVWTGPHYWQIVIPVGLALTVYCFYLVRQYHRNRKNKIIIAVWLIHKYQFLMKQLVSRDFKIKYKRSILGALWSFVNPLLMMSVQYVVFSTIFQADIQNYPVYLLAGIVLFNFFSESTNISLYAITGNAGLITKVYVPKYVYPVSKVVSTSIHLLISLIPLWMMSFATGVKVTKAWLLIPFDLLFLFTFCLGIGFMLSAAMVFFRDMQFIWSVFSMVLTYATPIFYPESILPDAWIGLLGLNPMYHFIQFFRKIILEGISPQPREYLICTCISCAFLAAGIWMFRKLQDKFIFYI